MKAFGNEPTYNHEADVHIVDVAYSNLNLTITEAQIIAFEDYDPFKLSKSSMTQHVCPQLINFHDFASNLSSLFSQSRNLIMSSYIFAFVCHIEDEINKTMLCNLEEVGV